MMKKATFLLLAVLLLSSSVLGESPVRVTVNGEYLEMKELPIVVNGRTLVPLRPIFEAMRMTPCWDSSTKTISVTNPVMAMSMTIGTDIASLNGSPIKLEAPPIIVNGTAMVPVRFVADVSGADVRWEPESRTVIITTSNYNGNQVESTFRLNGGEKDTEALADGINAGVIELAGDDGTRYQGGFANGLYNGKGDLTLPNGDRYIGEFKSGAFHGKGEMAFKNGDRYAGMFEYGMFHGKGTLTRKNGDVYTGDFVENRREGQGKLQFKSGDVYKGEWANDSYNGHGTYTFADGSKYVGKWVDGKLNGEARYTTREGYVYMTYWDHGKRVGDNEFLYIEN